MNAAKPGYKTTEFWLSLVTVFVGLLLSSGILPSDHVAMKIAGLVASVLSALGYSVARGNVKSAALAPVDPAQLLAADAIKRIEPSKPES